MYSYGPEWLAKLRLQGLVKLEGDHSRVLASPGDIPSFVEWSAERRRGACTGTGLILRLAQKQVRI